MSVEQIRPTIDPDVAAMTDRELLEESVILLRNQREVVSGLVAQIMESPLGAMMGKGGNPFGSLGR